MNSKILDKIGIDPAFILIALLILIIILFVLIFYLIANIRKRNRDIARLLSGKTAGDMEDIILERFAEMDAVKNNSKRVTKEHKEIQEYLSNCVSKIGLVKYDAFEGMGGSLSFALALMDSNNNGVVLNCMHSREGCFAYAKEIIRGESYVALSDEEKEAIERAKTVEEELEDMYSSQE
jgi:cell division protein FtsB